MWQTCVLLVFSLSAASGTLRKGLHGCAENEVYDPCPLSRPLTCDQMKNPTKCNSNQSCIPTCRCKEGFVFNDAGRCVQICDCMSCTRPNEFFDCGLPCDRACDNLDTKCDIHDASCTKRCYCKDGFARDENNDCIPIKKCKSDDRCPGKYQIYSYCTSGCPDICPGPDGILICGENKGCGPPGCDCFPGYLKTNGLCVLPKDCPPIICDRSNEVLSKLGETVSQTCDSILKIGPPIIRMTNKSNPRCVCKKGYVRGRDLRCVLAKNCEKCKKPNEEYSDCGPKIDATCKKPFSSVDIPCVEGCFCKEGFVRHNTQCINPASCPKQI